MVLVLTVATAGIAGGAAAAPVASADAAQDGCSYPIEETDATRTTVTLEEAPDRIVTAAPSAAQTLVEIGAWDRVVGVSSSASYLEGADEREDISAQGRVGVNVEKTVSLEPDLVLAPAVTPDEDVEKLREAGLTVFEFEKAGSVDEVKEKTRLMGRLTGACEGAEETVQWMESELSTVRQAVQGQDPVEALYVYSPDFGPYTTGSGTFIHDAIETAGAVNVAAEAAIEGHKTISDETVIQQDPQWLIVNTFDGQPPQTDAYNATTAVQEGNVVVVDTNHFNQPAPRVVLAIKKLAQTFHPEAYEQAQSTPTPSPSPSPSPSPTDSQTPTASPTETPESDEGSPGFGPVAALVALAAAALVAIRRR